jgi:hypothetical protein
MIEGGWDFVVAAYAIALGSLGVLAVVVVARLQTWSRRARELDKQQ